MAKKKTAATGSPKGQLTNLLKDELKMTDLRASLWTDMLMSLFKGLKPDMSKLDLVAHRRDLTSLATNWSKTTSLPANMDDTVWAFGADAISDVLENLIRTDTPEDDGGVVLFGAPSADEAEADKATVGAYLEALGVSVPEANKRKLEKNPKVLSVLKRLSRENQIRVLNSSTLLDILVRWGPLALRIIMMFLGL